MFEEWSDWHECKVSIVGNDQDIRSLRNFVKSKESLLDPNKILPVPKDGVKNEKRWKRDHWGTLELEIKKVKKRKGFLRYEFYSEGWRPPTPLFIELSKKFPNLEFTLAVGSSIKVVLINGIKFIHEEF